MKPNKTLILETYSDSDNEYDDAPSWARVVLTPKFVDDVKRLSGLCAEYGLKYVGTSDAPAEWHREDELRITYDTLFVDKKDCWFRAGPKHGNYGVETRVLLITSLEKALYGESDGETVIDGDVVYQNEAAKEAWLESIADTETEDDA